MFLPVEVSIPSKPGEELTSSTLGPLSERRRSTPAMLRSNTRAARIAVSRSARVMRTDLAEPPRCRLERKSPSAPVRFIEATTLLPMTRQRISSPAASLTKSCTRKFALSPRKASITDSAAFFVSARTTPLPCVDSSSLTISGAVPTRPIRLPVSLGEAAKAVLGMPTCARHQLMGIELVAAGDDARRGVDAVGADGFELADDGGAVGGDRGADAGHHGVVARQALAVVMHFRCQRVDRHVTARGVDHLDGVAAGFAFLDKAAGGIVVLAAEHGDAERAFGLCGAHF